MCYLGGETTFFDYFFFEKKTSSKPVIERVGRVLNLKSRCPKP